MRNNILIFLPNDLLGGAEQYLKMIARSFLYRNYVVHVFFLKERISSAWDDIQCDDLQLCYTHAKSEKGGLISFFKNLRSKKNINFEYAFTSHVHCSSFLGILRRLKLVKIKYFVARESTSVFKRFSGLKLFIFKMHYHIGYPSVDLLICQTDYMKNQLTEALPWLEKKIKVETMPNPIDIEVVQHQISSEPDIDISNPFLVSAGRLIPEKGFDVLIQAFSKISSHFEELNLVILGEGYLRESLSKLIADLNLQDKVFLLGFKPNVYPYFAKATMCVVASRIEGFPNVLLQMMSQNTKVVSTLCAGGIDEIQGLFTCQPENVDELSEVILNCLSTDTSESRKLFDNELKSRSVDKFIDKVRFIIQ